MKYLILRGSTRKELEDQVNKHLEMGYVLAGGLSVTMTPFGDLDFFQAVIIEKK